MSRQTFNTRSRDKLYLFGNAEDLSTEHGLFLPTYKQIVKCFQYVRFELKSDGSKEPPSIAILLILWHKNLKFYGNVPRFQP